MLLAGERRSQVQLEKPTKETKIRPLVTIFQGSGNLFFSVVIRYPPGPGPGFVHLGPDHNSSVPPHKGTVADLGQP
jgi:hypothetical protein